MYKELEELACSDIYPFHMPGHKRQPSKSIFDAAFSFDITEIDGFDNMHHPDGIIDKLQSEMAEIFRSEEAWILVNGSSAGILIAISAAVRKNGKIIMTRNSHKSAYNAAFLRNLEIVYLYPEIIEDNLINGGIEPDEVEKAIKENPDAEAVFITSPGYEGIVSDVESIGKSCHKYGKVLIVDSAHGAHFGINSEFDGRYNTRPSSKYADISIISLHKTLPVFTQTAAVLFSGDRIRRDKLREFYSIYQTSSPSYLFMASIDNCIRLIKNEGNKRFKSLMEMIDGIRNREYRNIGFVEMKRRHASPTIHS